MGASHHELDSQSLGELSAEADSLGTALNAVDDINGVIVLATCNRLEIYLDSNGFHNTANAVIAQVTKNTRWDAAKIQEALRVRVEGDAVRHLFSVASGLESMVVGETEISGQLKTAIEHARDMGTMTPLLENLTRSAKRCAKRIASTTSLSAEGRSTAGVAIDIAGAVLDGNPLGGPIIPSEPTDWSSRSTVLIGTGSIARIGAAALRLRGCTRLSVFSPSNRASAFASTHDAAILDADTVHEAMTDADLVITCSGRAKDVFTTETMTRVMQARGNRILPIIDLAVPGDVPPEVQTMDSVAYIGMDAIAIAAPSVEHREVDRSWAIVSEETDKFIEDEAVRMLDPAVIALRQHVQGTADKEIERLRARFDPEVADELEKSMHRLTQAVLHSPSTRSREHARNGTQAEYLKALHLLFGIDVEGTCPTTSDNTIDSERYDNPVRQSL